MPGELSAVETLFGWGTCWSMVSPGSGEMAQMLVVPLLAMHGTRQDLQQNFGMEAWNSPVQALLQARLVSKPEQDAQVYTENLPHW